MTCFTYVLMTNQEVMLQHKYNGHIAHRYLINTVIQMTVKAAQT